MPPLVNDPRKKSSKLENINQVEENSEVQNIEEGIEDQEVTKKKTKSKKTDKTVNLKKTKGLRRKQKIIARNLLRLYQFLEEDKPIHEESLIKELELNTPNMKLRHEIERLKLEIESVYEENQVFRQDALQTQIEWETKIELYDKEKDHLKQQIKEMDQKHQKEVQNLKEKYEETIKQLRSEIRAEVEKSEKFGEVNEKMVQIQAKVAELFDQNEALITKNSKLQKKLDETIRKFEEMEEEFNSTKKKDNELEKKVELQNIVIAGFKRKEEEKKKQKSIKEFEEKYNISMNEEKEK